MVVMEVMEHEAQEDGTYKYLLYPLLLLLQTLVGETAQEINQVQQLLEIKHFFIQAHLAIQQHRKFGFMQAQVIGQNK